MKKATVAGAAVVAAALLVSSIDAAAPAKVKAPWQLFPGQVDTSAAVLASGSAANRVWIATLRNDVPTLRSTRPSGGRLTSFTETRLPGRGGVPLSMVDDELVLPKPGADTPGQYVTAPLLANGRLGTAKDAPDMLAQAKEAAPKVDRVGIVGGVRVGDRTVWALEGCQESHTINGCRQVFFLACCSKSGAATDLSRFIDRPDWNVLFLQSALDTRRRIWLAWLDHRDYPHAARGVPRILQLDPSTLAPRTAALAAPGVIADRVKLACASSCRLVATTKDGDIVSWAPGEPRPTLVASAWRPRKCPGAIPASVLAAAYRSGHLVVAYQGSKGETQYCDATVRDKIWVVRGDARGAGAREVAAIPVANSWPPQNPGSSISGPFVYGTFAPGGVVAIEIFTYAPGFRSPLVGAFIPVRS